MPDYKGTIKFLPVKHGDEVDLGDVGIFGISGNHKYLGFKPKPGHKREGWLVLLVTKGKRAPKHVRKQQP